MARYQVGDRVVVRSDLRQRVQYYMDPVDNDSYWVKNDVTPSMMAFGGKTVEIVDFSGQYQIAGSHLWWTDEMFEGLESEIMGQQDVQEGSLLELLGG